MSTKPLGIKNYGSIPHLLGSKLGKHDKFIHEGQHKIMTEKVRDKHDQIYVTEKMDGSNVGIAKRHGRLIALTRSGYEADTSPYEQHHKFNKWVHHPEQYEKFNSLIHEGNRLVGEWCIVPHGTIYDGLNFPFFAFDLFRNDNNRADFAHLLFACEVYEIPTVPVLKRSSKGVPIQEAWDNLKLNRPYMPEGLVYRCERKNKFDFMAKWVRPDYEPAVNTLIYDILLLLHKLR